MKINKSLPTKVSDQASITSCIGQGGGSSSGRLIWRGVNGGQELVEFAILLPLLILILFGVLDLGRVFHATVVVANTARQGARFAIAYGYQVDSSGAVIVDEGKIQDFAVREAESSGIPLAAGDIAVNPGSALGYGSRLPVRVTVTYTFRLVMGWVLAGDTITVVRSAEMMIP